MKHTPGPWAFDKFGSGRLQAGKNGLYLGTFSESCGLGNAAEANKSLIVAAPDMLDALREFVEVMDSLPSSDETSLRVWDTYHTAVAAIKKSSGETK